MYALLKEEMFLTGGEFEYFRTTIFKLAGISLSDAKLELVQSRLRSRALKKASRDSTSIVNIFEISQSMMRNGNPL
jgi:chemotaxis methyl-accepting protein methylase